MLFLILNGALVYAKHLKKQNRGYKRENYYSWGKGAGAELIVEHELERLPKTYKVINDFNTGQGNIDHIVIGPRGIFIIETKASAGTIQYDGQKLSINGKPSKNDYLAQTHAEVNYLDKLLVSKTKQHKTSKSFQGLFVLYA